ARWAVDLGSGVVPPRVEQAQQTEALRRTAAGAAALIGLMALLIAAGLWGQRGRLRRDEDFVHWSVGAGRPHFLVRAIGEGRCWEPCSSCPWPSPPRSCAPFPGRRASARGSPRPCSPPPSGS